MNQQKEDQKELEALHNKNLLWNRVFTEIKSDKDLMEVIENSDSDTSLAVKAIAYLAVYKRLEVTTLVAMLFKPNKDNLDNICREVEKLVQNKLVNYDVNEHKVIVKFELEDEAQKEIDAFQYPLPLICKPKLIRHNFSSAYYKKNKQSVLLNKKTTEKDVDLEHLNLMNQTAFTINLEILKKVSNTWSPSGKWTQRQINRFNSGAEIAQKIMQDTGNKFYFSHRYDYRGRTYCEGYYLNYQGNDYCKSILELANKEIIE